MEFIERVRILPVINRQAIEIDKTEFWRILDTPGNRVYKSENARTIWNGAGPVAYQVDGKYFRI